MPPKQSNLPINGEQVKSYFQNISTTSEFLRARDKAADEYRHEFEDALTIEDKKRTVSAISRRSIALAASLLSKNQPTYEHFKMDRSYNTMISTLPDLNEGSRGLRERIGHPKENKKLIIPFNHAIKALIDEHQSTSLPQLTEMLENTFFMNGYSKGLLQDVNHHIIPGMIHELAGGTNLFYLPGDPEIIDTTVEDELRGVDEIVEYEDGIRITIDFKKSQEAALAAQTKHLNWRQDHGVIEADNHLIVASGYSGDDFIKDKIGRVTEEARLREQPRYNSIIENKHQELLRAKQFLDNLTKM
jgi:hypothetical protein